MYDLWGWFQTTLAVLFVVLFVALIVCGIIAEWRLRTGRVRRAHEQHPDAKRSQKPAAPNNRSPNADEPL